jgi:DNA invertase Pin-like site-specific DNA recombinase
VVICKLDRLARSTKHLLEIVEALKEKKAGFYSIGEPWADTTSHAGKIIMIILPELLNLSVTSFANVLAPDEWMTYNAA